MIHVFKGSSCADLDGVSPGGVAPARVAVCGGRESGSEISTVQAVFFSMR
jgi:hypothetical protein